MAAAGTNGKGSASNSKTRPKAGSDGSKSKSKSTATAEDASAPAPEPSGAPESAASSPSHVCGVAFCPIGLAISAVQPLRPDAVEHLLVAGRELFLAMRTIVDARAEQFEGEGTGATNFEKIDIG